MVFKKGHPYYKGSEKNWFKKGNTPWWVLKGIEHPAKRIEVRNKISEANKGKRKSPETEFKKGDKRYWLGKKRSKETKEKMSINRTGKCIGEENPFYGKKHNEETKNTMKKKRQEGLKSGKIKIWNKDVPYTKISGEKHWNWKGGITPENHRQRVLIQSKLWRKSVLKRDNYTCQECHERGGRLHAHHIKTWAKYPKLRFDVNNGITLCKQCHDQIRWKEEDWIEYFQSKLGGGIRQEYCSTPTQAI